MRAERVRLRAVDPEVPLAEEHLTVEPDYSDARDLCDERIERRSIEGRSIVVKRARGPARAALRREATVLGALDGVGVVELVEHIDDPSGDELWTLDGGPASLADPWTGTPPERAAWFGDGCRRLADLHARGWFHGAVTLDHLVVDELGGTTRWCSLGSAGRIADEPAGRRLDLIAITRAAHRLARSLPGSLGLRRRLDHLGAEADPRRIARVFQHWARRRGAHGAGERTERRARWLDPVAAVLRPRGRWPVERRSPEWRSPGWRSPGWRSPGWRVPTMSAVRRIPTGRLSGRATAALIISIISAGVALTLGAAITLRHPGAETPPTESPIPADPMTSDVTAVTPAESGPTVVAAGRTLQVGRAGDRAVVADARCSGELRVFALRPGTGEVFDLRVPSPSEPPDVGPGAASSGRLLLREPGLIDLVAPAGCGPPRAVRPDGSSTAVIPP